MGVIMPGKAGHAMPPDVSSLAHRRAAALRDQRQALRAEFAGWRGLTDAGQPFEKHHSQVVRITRQLENLLAAIGEPTGDSASAFLDNELICRRLLSAHRVWAYFRDKLALRDVTWLADDLSCADEFAYDCYTPLRDQALNAGEIAAGDLKEPPLVFFTTDASPYAQARGSVFEPQGVTGRDVTDFGAQLVMLPIPLIGVPWFQMEHLPAAPVIGHEVGHAVEKDFRLVATLKAGIRGLANLPAERQAAWLAWRAEVFADVYGALCTGPAFTAALMDYLVDDPAAIENERATPDQWGAYPPRFLRMVLNFHVLDRLGLADPGLEQAWRAVYRRHALPEFEPDIPAVIGVMLDTPFPTLGDLQLSEVLRFTADDLAAAGDWASRFMHGADPEPGAPFRRLFAAATLAYHDDLAAYQQANAQKPLMERLAAAIPQGQRGGARSPLAIAQHLEDLEQADQEASRKWLELFDQKEINSDAENR